MIAANKISIIPTLEPTLEPTYLPTNSPVTPTLSIKDDMEGNVDNTTPNLSNMTATDPDTQNIDDPDSSTTYASIIQYLTNNLLLVIVCVMGFLLCLALCIIICMVQQDRKYQNRIDREHPKFRHALKSQSAMQDNLDHLNNLTPPNPANLNDIEDENNIEKFIDLRRFQKSVDIHQTTTPLGLHHQDSNDMEGSILRSPNSVRGNNNVINDDMESIMLREMYDVIAEQNSRRNCNLSLNPNKHSNTISLVMPPLNHPQSMVSLQQSSPHNHSIHSSPNMGSMSMNPQLVQNIMLHPGSERKINLDTLKDDEEGSILSRAASEDNYNKNNNNNQQMQYVQGVGNELVLYEESKRNVLDINEVGTVSTFDLQLSGRGVSSEITGESDTDNDGLIELEPLDTTRGRSINKHKKNGNCEYEWIEQALKECDKNGWESYLKRFKKHKITEERLKHLPKNDEELWKEVIPEIGVRYQFRALLDDKLISI